MDATISIHLSPQATLICDNQEAIATTCFVGMTDLLAVEVHLHGLVPEANPMTVLHLGLVDARTLGEALLTLVSIYAHRPLR